VQTNLTTHTGLTTTAHGGIVPSTRSISAGTGLTGGGDLSADRTLAVALAASDIPSLDATKITSEVFDSARLGLPIGMTASQISGVGVEGGHALVGGTSSSTVAVSTGGLILARAERSGTANMVALAVSSSLLTAGQQIIVCSYRSDPATGLPSNLWDSETITVGTATGIIENIGTTFLIPAGGWVGVQNPSTNSGTVTLLAATGLVSPFIYSAGTGARGGLIASGQGLTPAASVLSYTYSNAAGATVFTNQALAVQVIGRLT
jgi:hypothetical protein